MTTVRVAMVLCIASCVPGTFYTNFSNLILATNSITSLCAELKAYFYNFLNVLNIEYAVVVIGIKTSCKFAK
jgi:hypothetical protein